MSLRTHWLTGTSVLTSQKIVQRESQNFDPVRNRLTLPTSDRNKWNIMIVGPVMDDKGDLKSHGTKGKDTLPLFSLNMNRTE